MKPIRISTLFSLFLIILLLSCTSNSVIGTVKNAAFFNQKMDDSITLNLDFKNTYFYSSNLDYDPEEERYFDYLLEELRNRKIRFSNTQDLRFTMVFKEAYYSEQPVTDTYTDEDGNMHTVNTTDHHFKVNGYIIDHYTCQRRSFAGEVSDGTKAGKNIFGMITEKGIITQEGMMNRATYRFAGRAVKTLNKFLEEKTVGRKADENQCDSITDLGED